MSVQQMNSRYPRLSSLNVERPSDGVLRICLNRPTRKNALDRELILGFVSAMDAASQDANVRVILLTGAGGSFCSGADLSTIADPEPTKVESTIDEFHQMIWKIVDAPQPVIAVLPGPAVGFGADLAMACDMRLLSDTAYIEESFVKIGLMPDGGGTHFMPKFAGKRAFEMIALGQRLDASACLEIGLANRVVPGDELDRSSLALAARFVGTAPLALAAIKRSLRESERGPLAQALAQEKRRQTRLVLSEDFKEGVTAFMQKRPPRFSGK